LVDSFYIKHALDFKAKMTFKGSLFTVQRFCHFCQHIILPLVVVSLLNQRIDLKSLFELSKYVLYTLYSIGKV